jgi:hypothetical protein
MKSIAVFAALCLLASAVLSLTVQDIKSCWDSSCKTEETACAGDTSCVNAGKYMGLCAQKLSCNENAQDAWNETCWEYCNYEETPSTTAKTWLTFERCHLNNCSPNRKPREFIPIK